MKTKILCVVFYIVLTLNVLFFCGVCESLVNNGQWVIFGSWILGICGLDYYLWKKMRNFTEKQFKDFSGITWIENKFKCNLTDFD